jgi:hypothetical protein
MRTNKSVLAAPVFMNTLSNHPENQYLASKRKSAAPHSDKTYMLDPDVGKLVKEFPQKVQTLQAYYPGGEAPKPPTALLLTDYFKGKKRDQNT